MTFPYDILTTENFAILVAGFLIFNLVKNLADTRKELEKLHQKIGKNTKAVLLLVLAQNGTRKKAKDLAQRMLDEEDLIDGEF